MKTMKQALAELWAKACRYDGIPADAKFVSFSEDNPYMKKYTTLFDWALRAQAMRRLQEVPR
jgi:hypothetical protein